MDDIKRCQQCKAPLTGLERKLCSLCVASGEHKGDLGWEDLHQNSMRRTTINKRGHRVGSR